jgi:hypothetical protein
MLDHERTITLEIARARGEREGPTSSGGGLGVAAAAGVEAMLDGQGKDLAGWDEGQTKPPRRAE